MQFGSKAVRTLPHNVSVYESGARYLKKPVFVGVGEVAKQLQKGRGEGLGSVEWLNLFDRSNDRSVQPFEPAPILPPIKLAGGIRDDEDVLLYVGSQIVQSLVFRNRINEVVQGISQIVNAISDDEAPPNQVWNLSLKVSHESMTGVTFVCLRDEYVTAIFRPVGDFQIDHMEVLFSAA